MGPLLTFLISAVVISLSGVMAPGPMTAATIAAGAKGRHRGALVAVGHGIIEFPLMAAILFGAGALLQTNTARIGIGLVGGLFLLLMGGQMLASMRKPTDTIRRADPRHPIWTGVILTAANPYFLLWWATVGLALATQAVEFGLFAFVLFAIAHWLCDLVWLDVLSIASHGGSKLLGRHTDRIIATICGIALLAFGIKFIVDALMI
jgi:threonine/homoserine/homoserine lactone efflux protein